MLLLKPWSLIYQHRQLLSSLFHHAIQSRYRNSWAGLLWPVLMPIFLIGVFSFVFGYVMPLKWASADDLQVSFPLFLFSGLVVFTFFSDVVNQAPATLLENVNLVKKVVFPLEMLCVAKVLVATLFFLINLGVFLAFLMFSGIYPDPVDLIYLLLVVPFALFLIGLSWFLASLTVYVRDIMHITGIIVSAIMFLSPVFFPLSTAPELVQSTMLLNPLSILIESLRGLLFDNQLPGVVPWLVIWTGGLACFYLGFWWFGRTKEGFADVI